jgi:nicotinate-nucleotide adenylyltransferase
MKRTAIFGGTFNPPHIGHLFMADEILHLVDCDTVLFVPTHIPPHKSIEDPGPSIRYSMLAESISAEDQMDLDDCEIGRSGVSYTIDTVRHLIKNGRIEPRPFLIIGDDLVDGFLSWKEPEALGVECEILVVHRCFEERLKPKFPHTYVDNKVLPVSSTDIRARIKNGESWRYLVPTPARKKIEELRLYGLA